MEGAELKFNEACEKLKGPIQIAKKQTIEWKKNDPLRFWQSLAFCLRSEDLNYVAVSSFVDHQGENKLFIATNDSMTSSQQNKVTDILNMFLDLKPVHEIADELLPRHFSYLIKQFRKGAAFVDDFVQAFPGELSKLMDELMFKRRLSLDDIKALLNLILENRKYLCAMKDGENSSEATKKIAHHLCKMYRFGEAIRFVWKKVKRHQEDPSLQLLSRSYQFISLNCHAELAILKTAMDSCASKTLYIGVSKRPCYCCSQLFKAVEKNKSSTFNISIVTTHGKLYRKWNKIGGDYLWKEFNQVWTKVIQKVQPVVQPLKLETDENSWQSLSCVDDDDKSPLFLNFLRINC